MVPRKKKKVMLSYENFQNMYVSLVEVILN